MISNFFIPGIKPSASNLQNEEFLQESILSKKTARSSDYLSLVLCCQNTHPELIQPNPFNEGGYRYFIGIPFLEISNDLGRVGISYSVLFFETFLPMASFFRQALSMILGEIKLKKLEVYNQFKSCCDDFCNIQDYTVFGYNITVSYFERQSKPNCLFEELYKINVYDGIGIQRSGVNLHFKAELNNAKHLHSLEALNLLPSYITPDLVFKVLGALLQEKVLVLHCNSRPVLFDFISFLLSLISPLSWPYPVIPLLSPDMEDFVDSPVPLVAGIEEDPSLFEARWSRRLTANTNAYHVQLNSAKTLGNVLIDFKSEVVLKESQYDYNRCNYLHDDIRKLSSESKTDDMGDMLSINSPAAKTRIELIKLYKKFIRCLYLEGLDEKEAKIDKSRTFTETMNKIRQNSKFPVRVLEAFMCGQIFQNYLETLRDSDN